MAKGRKKKKARSAFAGGLGNGGNEKLAAKDPLLYGLLSAEREGDNRRASTLCLSALGDGEASPEAKEAALRLKKSLAYDPVAFAFAGGGALFWAVLLTLYVLGRG